jgi:type II secretory pathway component GspD/PulD (secretin)
MAIHPEQRLRASRSTRQVGRRSRGFVAFVLLGVGLMFHPVAVLAQDRASAPATVGAPEVTLDVRDADLRQVFQNLALKAGINILISPKVKGTVTCRIVDMDPVELIYYLARTNGLILERHGNILLVLAENPPGTRTRMEIIPLQNANAAEVARIIQNLQLDKRARVTHDERTNRLIVVYEE